MLNALPTKNIFSFLYAKTNKQSKWLISVKEIEFVVLDKNLQNQKPSLGNLPNI